MKIILDAMGSDNAPDAQIAGSVQAVKEFDDIEIVLVGQSEIINAELDKYDYPKHAISVVHAPDVITNNDEPAKAVRTKKESSMVVGATMLKNDEGDAFVSMGNTGALLASALLIVGRIKGVLRPALAPVIPTSSGVAMLIDAGANADCKSANLVQFAIMGSVYMKKVLGYESPSVGLVNIGAEEKKGNELTREAHQLLKQQTNVNFYGNVEGSDIVAGKADIVVCDGFAGNLVLKVIEGMGGYINKTFKGIFFKNIKTKFAAVLVKDGLKNFKKTMDYREYGGSPFLGIKKPVIKAHGSSDARAVYSTVKQVRKIILTDVIGTIQTELEKTDLESAKTKHDSDK